MRERDVGLSALSQRPGDRGLQVSIATLRYWRSGQRQPGEASMESVEAIEEILGLATGELIDVIPT